MVQAQSCPSTCLRLPRRPALAAPPAPPRAPPPPSTPPPHPTALRSPALHPPTSLNTAAPRTPPSPPPLPPRPPAPDRMASSTTRSPGSCCTTCTGSEARSTPSRCPTLGHPHREGTAAPRGCASRLTRLSPSFPRCTCSCRSTATYPPRCGSSRSPRSCARPGSSPSSTAAPSTLTRCGAASRLRPRVFVCDAGSFLSLGAAQPDVQAQRRRRRRPAPAVQGAVRAACGLTGPGCGRRAVSLLGERLVFSNRPRLLSTRQTPSAQTGGKRPRTFHAHLATSSKSARVSLPHVVVVSCMRGASTCKCVIFVSDSVVRTSDSRTVAHSVEPSASPFERRLGFSVYLYISRFFSRSDPFKIHACTLAPLWTVRPTSGNRRRIALATQGARSVTAVSCPPDPCKKIRHLPSR